MISDLLFKNQSLCPFFTVDAPAPGQHQKKTYNPYEYFGFFWWLSWFILAPTVKPTPGLVQQCTVIVAKGAAGTA